MAKFNEYAQKATPEDNDTLMIYDDTAKANKLSPFSGIWNWMVGKLTNAVIANLQTNNKTVLGAINELNSKAKQTEKIFFACAYNHEANSISVVKELPDSNCMMVIFGNVIESGMISKNGEASGFSHYTITYQDGVFSIKGQMEWYTTIPVLFGW